MSPWELPLSTKPVPGLQSHDITLRFLCVCLDQSQFLMLARKEFYCLGHLLCHSWILDLKENLLPGNSSYTPDLFCLRFLLSSLLFSYSWFIFKFCSNFYKTHFFGKIKWEGERGLSEEIWEEIAKIRYVSGILWKPNKVDAA